MRRWSARGLALSASCILFGACGSSTHDDATGSGGGSGTGTGNPTTGGTGTGGPGTGGSSGECVSGKTCTCSPGRSGVTQCQFGSETCRCDCPALMISDATHVQPCSGTTTGAWLLTHLELGKTTLQVTSAGQVIGGCAAQMTPKQMTVPRALMDLAAGGTARYFSEAIPFSIAWTDSCVTGLVPALGCEKPQSRNNLYACALDCDTCSCTSSLTANSEEDGTWQRTDAKLTLGLWGTSQDYAYCLKDDVLSLSTDGAFLSFKHVYPFSKPTACAQRTADKCTAGSGCRLGACSGSTGCDKQYAEGTCLTVPGCSWDPKVCGGSAQAGCQIGDYGVVPGCDLLDHPLTCAGTPTACGDRDQTTCTQDRQCTLSSKDTCVGGPLNCGLFTACPDGYCQLIGSQCVGSTSCEAHLSMAECGYIPRFYPNSPCAWKTVYTCSGTVAPCSSYTPETCESVAGCHVQDGSSNADAGSSNSDGAPPNADGGPSF